MRVVWSANARRDRDDIFAYIAERNAVAAVKTDERLFQTALSLDRSADRGRPGRAAGTRELAAIFPYVIIYGVDHQRQLVRILRIWHAARERDRS